MDTILYIGILAGAMQILGYYFYLKNEDIEPNPVTWFMFAYGTAILTILEWDSNASLAELILPATCTVLSIIVSARCWMRARRRDPSRWWPEDWWPDDRWEQWSFVSDIIITICYVGAWALATWALLSPEHLTWAVLVFLFLTNISIFPSFYPLLRETYLDPRKESSLPWVIWTMAYILLAFVAYYAHKELWHPLMFYPLSNIFLHGLVAWLARPSAQRMRTELQ